MSYTALYRKFRPATFEDVKGQEHIVTTLKNQIASDRIGHAYLFCGTRGTGKTTIAKILARAVNCENPKDGSPCGECPTCKAILSGGSMNVIEIDAASNNGVDNIREIVEEVSYSPTEGRFKVYIIDEVHMLSLGAFNALLKTLEEPPSYVIFILATTEVHKIPITILSRCQRYDFRRITIDTIADRLRELMVAEHVDVEDKALRYVAKTADGSMRDALSLLDQCIAFHFGETLTYDMALDVLGAVDTEVFSNLLQKVYEQDVLGCMQTLEDVIAQGRELPQFVTDFTWYLRNLLLIKTSEDLEDVIDMSSENLRILKQEASQFSIDVIMRFIRIFSELSGQIKYASQKRILVEIALIKLCKPEMDAKDESLPERVRMLENEGFAERISALEERIRNGVTVNSSAMQAPAEPVVKAPLPKAVPEEIEQIVSNWGKIVSRIGNPMATYLRAARVSLSGDGKLALVVEDGLHYDYLKEREKDLAQFISNQIGKEVDASIQPVRDNREMDERYPDLLQVIHMNVAFDDNEDI